MQEIRSFESNFGNFRGTDEIPMKGDHIDEQL
jgi:hypothetical protein